ncbi:MAG TPA: Rrf2 family transcriptional regulator [Chthoniobacteraceae bacterium]|nr:Rrf2 family transcriptional regulator [Chthoniobacteraceae bacterium]
MAGSCRFAFAVHALAMLAAHPDRKVTSEEIARSVNTHAVVIRRLMAALRQAGLITTGQGPGRGSALTRAPRAISLAALYRAVKVSPTFAMHPHAPNRRCPVGRNIQAVLAEVALDSEEALERALAKRSIADVVGRVRAGRPQSKIGASRRGARKTG